MIGRIDLKQINTVLPQLLSTILSAQSFKIQPVSNTSHVTLSNRETNSNEQICTIKMKLRKALKVMIQWICACIFRLLHCAYMLFS